MDRLNSFGVVELKQMAKERGIKGLDKLRKVELIEAIRFFDKVTMTNEIIIYPDQTFQGQLPTRGFGDRNSILSDLHTYGYSVIQVFPVEVAFGLYSMLWDSFEQFGKICRSEPQSWSTANWPYNFHGIIKHYKVGWWPVMWKARELLKPFWASLWQTEDLITSFDGCCLMRPPECNSALYPSGSIPWHHRDQSLFDPNFKSIQLVLNLLYSSSQDGGLEVWPELHHCTDQFQKELPGERRGFCRFPVEVMKRFRSLKINLRPGEVAIWDSRLPHQNVPPMKGRDVKGRSMYELFRAVLYITMFPRTYLTEKGKEIRRKCIHEFKTTSHYAPESDINAEIAEQGHKELPIPRYLRVEELNPIQKSLL